ncbi:MAG TPA: GIY-YIG nuclease family protein [Candidatus Babeliaceae bacterium]|nr:GIY-YIG nuclease family protein [Candidatus Babeliaceae bacterium]
MFYVYILESLIDGDYYKGYTTDYVKRLNEHNNGESSFTRSKRPWKLIYVSAFETKKEALIEEKRLKRCNKQYINWLTAQPANLLNKKPDR